MGTSGPYSSHRDVSSSHRDISSSHRDVSSSHREVSSSHQASHSRSVPIGHMTVSRRPIARHISTRRSYARISQTAAPALRSVGHSPTHSRCLQMELRAETLRADHDLPGSARLVRASPPDPLGEVTQCGAGRGRRGQRILHGRRGLNS